MSDQSPVKKRVKVETLSVSDTSRVEAENSSSQSSQTLSATPQDKVTRMGVAVGVAQEPFSTQAHTVSRSA